MRGLAEAAQVRAPSSWRARAFFVAYEETVVRGRSHALDLHALPLRRA